jgi:hypothetical protein
MSRFRIKFILADGRRVYASKRGEVQLMTEEEFARTPLDRFVEFAYTHDLMMFGPAALLRTKGQIVQIVDMQREPEHDPLDAGSFLTGGRPVM